MEESMKLMLLVEKKTGQIIYAEAGKDFVDLVFSFSAIPIGSVIKLLSSSSFKTFESINNIFASIDKLPSVHMKCDKSVLLNPIVDPTSCHKTLSIDYGECRCYICGNYTTRTQYSHYVTSITGDKCMCRNPLKYEVRFDGNDNSSNAVSTSTGSRSSCDLVEENVTFMITDDLTISPSSTMASIALLNSMNIKDFSHLEQKSVTVGPEQAVKLLWASLVSTTALNDVFSSTVSIPTKEALNQTHVEGVEPCKPR